MNPPDPHYADPRLAAIYDDVDGDRSDLDLYEVLIGDARRVLDVGCGTGSLACRLAERGLEVVAVDPAEASLEVARSKCGGAVRWIHGDATTLPDLAVDAATMTGNVAQIFLEDADWLQALGGIRDALRRSGRVIFETRDPAARAWERWTPERTRRVVHTVVGPVEYFIEVTDAAQPFVRFTATYRFERTGETLTSTSTLRFRPRGEIEESLVRAGFSVIDVVDASDRPGLEFVFVAERM